MGTNPLASALLAIAAAPWCALATPALTVSVTNEAGLPDSVVGDSIRAASNVFRVAGIASRWVTCSAEGCSEEPPGEGLYLRLFITARQKTPLPNGAMGTLAGFALKGGSSQLRGYAFFDVVKGAAERYHRRTELVLACVLAHEAGHLLGLKHERHGIMRANLAPEDMDRILVGRGFGSAEERQLRAAVSAYRHAETVAVPALTASTAQREQR